MKKAFMALVRAFGGDPHYCGSTRQPVFEQQKVIAGPKSNPFIITATRMTGFTYRSRTMFIKGMDEEAAMSLKMAWGETPVPFNVVFQ